MASPPDIGDVVLERYRLTRVIGRGGVGTVFAADDERLGRTVAVKVLGARGRSVRNADARLQREARTLAALVHPNLVTLLDYDVLPDGSPAMVMEFVDGVNLQSLLSAHAFTPEEILRVLDQTLAALVACHERGVIHRDLKPGNLLVDASSMAVKVIDFGIVQLLGDEGATALTVNGEVFGSPRFMAPEQWQQGLVDARTDLYALGLIGYCMVLGQHFIRQRNPVAVFEHHLRGPRPPLTATGAGCPVPPALAAALARAASPRPEDRFESAQQMRDALAGLGAGAPIAADLHTVDRAPALDGFDATEVTEAVAAASSMEQPIEAIDDDFFDDDGETVVAEAPEAVETPPPPTRERVRFGVPGGVSTQITKGDVERALSAGPPAAMPVLALGVPAAAVPDAAAEVPGAPPAPASAPPRPPAPASAPPRPRVPSSAPLSARPMPRPVPTAAPPPADRADAPEGPPWSLLAAVLCGVAVGAGLLYWLV
ncbi:MAG: serine/threonine protein kinase [Myxococcales bacterium]|nr:serine/threonine protein kinase [Myxococcales bacterium]